MERIRRLEWAVPAAAAQPLMAVCGVMLLMALGALIKIPLPFTPVPVTLQVFAALFAGLVLPARQAALGVALYVGLGLLGMPWLAATSMATAGYLAGMIIAPYVIGMLGRTRLAVFAALGVIYALGVGWLAIWTPMPFTALLVGGVLPFLPLDGIKAVIAWRLGKACTAD